MSRLYMTASGVVVGWEPEDLENYCQKCERKGLPKPYPVRILAGPELEEDDDNPKTNAESDH